MCQEHLSLSPFMFLRDLFWYIVEYSSAQINVFVLKDIIEVKHLCKWS